MTRIKVGLKLVTKTLTESDFTGRPWLIKARVEVVFTHTCSDESVCLFPEGSGTFLRQDPTSHLHVILFAELLDVCMSCSFSFSCVTTKRGGLLEGVCRQ